MQNQIKNNQKKAEFFTKYLKHTFQPNQSHFYGTKYEKKKNNKK